MNRFDASLAEVDPEIAALVREETERQEYGLELIASENFVCEAILEAARSQQRIIVTIDKDFGELAILRRMPHCGIIRLVDFSGKSQARECGSALLLHLAELLRGAIVTVEPGRIRVRPSDLERKG